MSIGVRRVYDKPAGSDGYRVLIDRVWPRGVSKKDAKLDAWNKDVAPSTELRKWFGHDPAKWEEFKKRYKLELSSNRQAFALLLEKARTERVTLVFGSKDEIHSKAAVLREYLEQELEK